MRRFLGLVAAAGAAGLLLLSGGQAWACGGLVAPNGAVRLLRTSTLAAWHAGVEHYVTSFQFSGQGSEFGSIVPLPAIPTAVVRGGDWTLQRLEREVAPPIGEAASAGAGGAAAASPAQVVLTTRIDALDITVLKGGGQAVGDWARQHGYLLTPDAPAILDFYARRSPIFLAARFDAAAARSRGQQVGDGTPVHITMPLRRPWVPLRILTLGLGPLEPVPADVFLLTDKEMAVHLPADGAEIALSSPASSQLLADLRSDKGMEWVPESMWLTFVRVQGPGRALRTDLTTTALRTSLPPPVATTTATTAAPTPTTPPTVAPALPDLAARPLSPASHHRSMPAPALLAAVGLVAGASVAAAVRFGLGSRRLRRPR
ncbi:MAG: DUF2330 domain-containing protein [Actinobacteria bacterium]|nr:MAG: DUF2330 domain-containing protein [Actinomycetota bacterium]